MSNPTVPDNDPQARVHELLASITVTNIETGKPLDRQAKLGRVIAACRGYEATLVRIDWGTTSPDEVRAALDALRGDGKPPVLRLAQARAQRLVNRCLTPARASRASDRVHKLALRAQARGEVRLADDLLCLSTALNERRHAIIQARLGSDDFQGHADEIRYLIGRLPSEVAA